MQQRLQESGLRTWIVGEASHGDAHLAIGQAWVAAAWLRARGEVALTDDGESFFRCDPMEN